MLFELHQTTSSSDVKGFARACKALDIKPLDIRLEGGGAVPRQVMTAYVFEKDSIDEALEVRGVLHNYFAGRGFEIVRSKLEVPLDKSAGLDVAYFETHVKIHHAPDEPIAPVGAGWHLSWNALAGSDGLGRSYLTRRAYASSMEEAAKDFVFAYTNLHGFEATAVRMEMEAVVFDSNPELDAGWAHPS